MPKHLLIIVAFFSLGIQCNSPDLEKINISGEPFETAEVYFEQNSTDGDAEVVFKATAGDQGLINLLVIAPDDRIVVDFEVPDTTSIGIRQFQLESPEPEDIDAVKKAYPSGVYKFSGITRDGTEYFSEATLNHTLPPPVAIQYPLNEMEDVSINDLEITWSSIADAELYLIEVEQEDSDVKIEATLLSSESTFLVPEEFLLPDMEYKVVIGLKSANGNLNFTEIAFSTIAE
jgi:hypothetical protein